ncbi:MAG: hypothetical protein E7635_05385 [Ruminococcaceae bacterium]|nr:hypothetical protein [Oscillospiraceae bacterium]
MEQLEKGYKKLYEATNIPQGYTLNKEKIQFEQLSHFIGMKGKKYDTQQIRLLFVGRAVNGWEALKNLSCADEFAVEATKKFENNFFDWVVYDKEKGVLRNDYVENGEYYWLNDSPFWRTNKKIWMKLSNNLDFKDNYNDRWVDYIAWTNLYKIAPKDTGNPTTTMAKKQLNACKNILKAEIEKFKPTHILFVTGYEWWFECFADMFAIEFNNVKKNEYRGENKNSFFVEASGTTADGVKIVVSCRPELRNENLYVDDINNSFN